MCKEPADTTDWPEPPANFPWEVLYAAVAARRLQWDNLLWQVPVLSLTAHAFLLTISLGADSTWWARAITGCLSALVSVMSIMLMVRHRMGELTDSHWCRNVEGHFEVPEALRIHGKQFAVRRDSEDLDVKQWVNRIPSKPMFALWVWGLGAFGLVGLAVATGSILDHFAN